MASERRTLTEAAVVSCMVAVGRNAAGVACLLQLRPLDQLTLDERAAAVKTLADMCRGIEAVQEILASPPSQSAEVQTELPFEKEIA